MKTAVFIGHNECFGLSEKKLRAKIIECIESGVTRFLNGGQGGFDRISAVSIFKLKKKYPHIKNILVIPYLTFNVFNKDIFDEITFPEGFEKYHYKEAIPKRNRFMVEQSDIAICYVHHSWGNAAKTHNFAEKQGLKIINL